MKMKEQLDYININQIIPPHKVYNDFHYKKIKRSMKKWGWKERPLLVLKRGQKYQALTGSHRYQAAKDTNLKKVPCVVIRSRKIVHEWNILIKKGFFFEDYEKLTSKLRKEKLFLAALLFNEDIE